MPDLITISRACQNPTLMSLSASNPAYLASLVTAASDSVRRECGREFLLAAFSEYHSGGIYIREPLRLRQYPVAEITRVAASPRAALLIQNFDDASNQRATFETTSTALRLVTVASAVLTTTDFLYATYPTVAQLAAAVNALGNGWSATVRNDLTNWPSADFKPLQGAVSALNGGHDLEMYSEIVQPFTAWPSSGGDGDWDDGFQGASGWRLDEETGELFGRFPRGQLNIRIDYRAGFVTTPQAIQEACVQLAQDLYQAALVNNTLQKSTLGASSVTLKNTSTAPQLSPKVQLLLAPYRDYAKAIFR
ncbi:MAG TPA: hypothetical protein VG326_08535 [Tepidisphaeraceae bacterium]|jgi:hypothetical protein|nr:hypothetical protein [Tepidisphaeraceae bacterium]